jgi:hypothetical protein
MDLMINTSSKHSTTSSASSNAKKSKMVSTEVKMVVTSELQDAGGREEERNSAICSPCAWHS